MVEILYTEKNKNKHHCIKCIAQNLKYWNIQILSVIIILLILHLACNKIALLINLLHLKNELNAKYI